MALPQRSKRKIVAYSLLLGTLFLTLWLTANGSAVMSAPNALSPLSILLAPQSPLQQPAAAFVPPVPTEMSPLQAPSVLDTPTPTPIPATPTSIPTPTPKPTPVLIDLAGGLPKEAIFTFFVQRANGSEQIYQVPLSEVPFSSASPEMTDYLTYRLRRLQLQPGDQVIYECAPTTATQVPEQFRCMGRKHVKLNTPPE